jgi:hypothetical protein
MKARLVLAVVLLSSAACADEQKKQLAPTAPPPSKSAVAAPISGAALSTVCLKYARDLALAQADLKDHPTSQRNQERASKLDGLIKDACQ